MRPQTRRALDALRNANFTDAQLRALFADIRKLKDEKLLAKPKAKKAKSDPLIDEVTALLAPILARSGEKAAMLVKHLAKLTGRKLTLKPAGLAPTIRALRKHLSDDDIRDGAFGLRVQLQRAQGKDRLK